MTTYDVSFVSSTYEFTMKSHLSFKKLPYEKHTLSHALASHILLNMVNKYQTVPCEHDR